MLSYRIVAEFSNSFLLDFKSYKGHHVLLFGDSYFTSIVGPNGSGKSNSYVPPLLFPPSLVG